MTGLGQVLKEIANVTNPQADDNALYAGELETLTEMLDSLASLTYNHKNATKDISKVPITCLWLFFLFCHSIYT